MMKLIMVATMLLTAIPTAMIGFIAAAVFHGLQYGWRGWGSRTLALSEWIRGEVSEDD